MEPVQEAGFGLREYPVEGVSMRNRDLTNPLIHMSRPEAQAYL